jgi:small subunit ribosomal protein S17
VGEEKTVGHRKTRVGMVVSDRMSKTIVVSVEKRVLHPVYKKYVRRRLKLKTHDEGNTARVGDIVLIEETRPLSKEKRWRLKEVIQRAPVV